MAKVCPLSGCKEKPGLCIHDKMAGMMVVAVIVVGVVFAVR